MTGTARAFWTTAIGSGEIREESLPDPSPGDVVVRTRFSGISRGTESLVFGGRVPPSEYDRMRAPFMGGAFPFPVKYGYCSVGVVEQGPTELVGREVFCLFPHQTRYVVPRTAVTALPEGLPARRAVLTANMETAVNAVWDARVSPGDRIAVIGGGVVGSLVAHLATQTAGVEVTLIDIDATKQSLAQSLGVAFASPQDAGEDYDIVFHASGHPAGLRTALEVAGVEARVIELSWYGDRSVDLPLGQAFHARRLSIVSSQVGTIPAHQRSRWTYARRLALAARLLQANALDVLLGDAIPFDDLPSAMPKLTAPGAASLCHVVTYPG